MSGRRRAATIVFAIVALWAIGLTVWAVRPLSDSVPVGIDHNLAPPREVSQDVDCNSLFSSSARPDEPLPALPVQPALQPPVQPLAYQRTPCALVHDQARVLFAINVVMALAAAIGGVALLTRRRGRTAEPAVVAAPA